MMAFGTGLQSFFNPQNVTGARIDSRGGNGPMQNSGRPAPLGGLGGGTGQGRIPYMAGAPPVQLPQMGAQNPLAMRQSMPQPGGMPQMPQPGGMPQMPTGMPFNIGVQPHIPQQALEQNLIPGVQTEQMNPADIYQYLIGVQQQQQPKPQHFGRQYAGLLGG